MSAPGPAVVALGGGHGLAASLRAIRGYAETVTAVVSVADDGGSSGRLRRAYGIPAPGDLRKCLIALGDAESVWARAFEHRFDAGELEGHALGNLVIAGLLAATGDFAAALDQAGTLLGAVGRVLPATEEAVVLKAEADFGEVSGQVRVAATERISAVTIAPADARPPAAVLDAIAAADQVVLGPGSLFTSVLAVIAVPAIRDALAAAAAQKVYVCNLRPQVPETQGFDVAAHVRAVLAHGVEPDVVLYDPAALPVGDLDHPAVAEDLTATAAVEHDPVKLAAALAALLGR